MSPAFPVGQSDRTPPLAQPTPPLAFRWLGRRSYEEVWALQKELVEAIADQRAPETLLLVEHERVITLGRKAGAQSNVLDAGDCPIFSVERGGDATYHGPGQLVGYPLLRLQEGERDLHRYLRNLEGWLALVLKDFGLTGESREALTGVWVGDRKLASVGVAVRRWVTYHGFALNVTTDLGEFARLQPCGLQSDVMSSLAALTGREVGLDAVIESLARHAPVAIARRALREDTGA